MFDWLKKLFQRKAGAKEIRPVAWSAMAGFLEDLEAIGNEHEEIYDTDVRERIWEVTDRFLIKQATPLDVPDDLGMFSAEANARLKAALEENLQRVKEVFSAFELNTEEKRRVSFLNPRLTTESGRHVDEFFGSP